MKSDRQLLEGDGRRNCESNGCVVVDTLTLGDGSVSVRFHSTETGTTMRATQAEADDFIRRVKNGELDYLLQDEKVAVSP